MDKRRRRTLLFSLALMLGLGALVAMLALCSNAGVIEEEEGKALVAATTEVRGLVAAHGDEHVRILALAQHQVHDRDIIAELYPGPDREEVTCVIVATAGDDGFVFLQGEDFRILRSETLDAFTRRTADVDAGLMARFWLSLA